MFEGSLTRDRELTTNLFIRATSNTSSQARNDISVQIIGAGLAAVACKVIVGAYGGILEALDQALLRARQCHGKVLVSSQALPLVGAVQWDATDDCSVVLHTIEWWIWVWWFDIDDWYSVTNGSDGRGTGYQSECGNGVKHFWAKGNMLVVIEGLEKKNNYSVNE